jgi:hypothetical protein
MNCSIAGSIWSAISADVADQFLPGLGGSGAVSD